MSIPGKPHILLVDDEGSILLSYRIIFEQHGYRVTCARSAAEATQALAEHRFDLVMCDMALEGQESGIGVIHSAREQDPCLPCVLLTGYPESEMPEAVREDGIQVLFKPTEVPSVLSTVDFLLRRRKREKNCN